MDNKLATLKLDTKSVGALLMQCAMSTVIVTAASSLYNMIDHIFTGQVAGPLTILGLVITFPLVNSSAVLGTTVSVGPSTAISVKLGQKDYDVAENVLGNSVTLNIIIGLAFGIICLIFLDPITLFFGASESTLSYV